VVLVGDPKQLPATVKSLVAQKLSLARSLFERLQAWI
jgi:superfamily I DNA and/or RNA helicase